MPENKHLSAQQATDLLATLKARFESNMGRHSAITWAGVQEKLENSPGALWALQKMDETGGEPDVIGYDENTGEYTFCDCAAESPAGRRSLCYDRAALDARKKNKPENSAVDVAAAMGITLLTEEEYRALQALGEFDLKTSSWVLTPGETRALGGALFCDRRYNRVFTYHNGADSYYSARGFRGALKV